MIKKMLMKIKFFRDREIKKGLLETKISEFGMPLIGFSYAEWECLKKAPNYDTMTLKEAQDYINKRGYVL